MQNKACGKSHPVAQPDANTDCWCASHLMRNPTPLRCNSHRSSTFDCSTALVKTCLDSQTAVHVPQYFMIILDSICHGGLDDWSLNHFIVRGKNTKGALKLDITCYMRPPHVLSSATLLSCLPVCLTLHQLGDLGISGSAAEDAGRGCLSHSHMQG